MSELTEEQFALSAAAQAFCNRGIAIACPWEGDLDDEERERFDALVAAVECYNTALSVAPAFMPPAPVPSHEHPIRDRGERITDAMVEAAARALCRNRWLPDHAVEAVEAIVDAEWRGHARDARAALLAALPPARVEEGPRVKKLEWVKHDFADLWRADSLLGRHQVYAVISQTSWAFDGWDGITQAAGDAADIEAAKAAAQADYEARIRGALE